MVVNTWFKAFPMHSVMVQPNSVMIINISIIY